MSKISLRVIDHFITNYSKKNRITYNLIENNQVQIFNVNASYKSQLKAYNKKYFDPFCRRERILFFDHEGKEIIKIDPRYFRPTEVETLLGDASKAKEKLNWSPKISFQELVKEMVEEDLSLLK